MQTTEESGGRALLSPKVGRGPRAEFPPAKEIWQGLRFVFREENRIDLYQFSAPPVLLIESKSVRRTAVLSSENRPGWSQNKGSCTIYGHSTLHWQSYFTSSDSYKNPCVLSRQVKCVFHFSEAEGWGTFARSSNNTQCLHRIFFGIISAMVIIPKNMTVYRKSERLNAGILLELTSAFSNIVGHKSQYVALLYNNHNFK